MAAPAQTHAHRIGLGAVLLLALLHAWLHASVRPLLQVSDELSYLTAVQGRVIDGTDDVTLRRCAAPPDGRLLDVTPGGKRLFRQVGASVVAGLCARGLPPVDVFWLLRLLFGLSLPLLALITYGLARDLCPDDPQVPLGAAAVVALQPVAAGLAGGITPDGLANLFAALALWLGTRQVTNQARWWEVPAFVAATACALASKDTAAFLAPTLVLALAVRAWSATDGAAWRRHRPVLLLVALAGLPLVAWLAVRYTTPTALTDPQVAVPAAAAWPALLRDAFGHLLVQFPALVETAWLPVGNFGASTLALPSAFRPLPWLIAGAAGVGALALLTSPDVAPSARRAAQFWLVGLVGCALQPGIREAVLHLPDVYQGRWLFPLLPALATLTLVGLTRLGGPSRRILPLVVVVAVATAAMALVALAGHHYLQFPATLDTTSLFLRSSTGAPLDDARLATWVARPAALSAPGPFVVAGLAWLAASALTLAAAARLPLRLESRLG